MQVPIETRDELGRLCTCRSAINGLGIPFEYQTKIFQKLVQVKGQELGGTGLGPAICKEIVRAHGGTIWVESMLGQGSTFTFTVPVAR